MSDLEKVKLRNSTREEKSTIENIVPILEKLEREEHVAFNQLIAKCRDPKHIVFGSMSEILKKYGLMKTDGTIDESISNIVKSSVRTISQPFNLVHPIRKAAGKEIKEVLQAEQGEKKEDIK